MEKKVLKNSDGRLAGFAISCCAPQTLHAHTILQTRTAENGCAILGFGLTHAPIRIEELDRKNTIVGKCSRKAATATNKQFGSMAGVARWKTLQNSKLNGSWQVQVARHCAKLPGVMRHSRTAQCNFE